MRLMEASQPVDEDETKKMQKYLAPDDVWTGDVLLCYAVETADELQAGSTGYSHVAIALSEGRILEATSAGVKIVDLAHLTDEYSHLAVMRGPDLWDAERLTALHRFAAEAVGKRFNQMGLGKYTSRKASINAEATARLEKFFANESPDVTSDRALYFCSELVTAAFIHVGIIKASAAIVLSPEAMSPSDLAMDKVFGFFLGYLTPYPAYRVPCADYFQTSL